MNDISPIVIEMRKLLKDVYEEFNEQKYSDAYETAIMLQAAAIELVGEMQPK